MIWVHDIDPVAFRVGSIPVAWYGLMYLAGYALALAFGLWRVQQGRFAPGALAFLDLVFYAMLGVVVGARLGHALLYAPLATLADPLSLLRVWEGGMSFHGGALGVILAAAWWARACGRSLAQALDFLVPLAPLGIACGRLGNWINGELWGVPTNAGWGVVFPGAGDALPRHPSQLYELALEGLLLFVFVWHYSARPRAPWAVSAAFALGYACARFTCEFLRAPEPGVVVPFDLPLSYGQWLTLPLAGLGGALVLLAASRFSTRASSSRPSDSISSP